MTNEIDLEYDNSLRLSGTLLSRKLDISNKLKLMTIEMKIQNSQHMNPSIIRELYWEKKKSLPEIGEMFSVHHEKIRRLMIKYKIPLRSRLESQHMRKKLKVGKSELYEMYWKKEMKLRDIAKLFDVSAQIIFMELKKYGIPRRTYSEARTIQRRKVSPKELRRLYLEEKTPLIKLAPYIRTRFSTARKMVIDAGVSLRSRSEAIEKYPRLPFSGDEKEKYYLLGIRAGDLSAWKDGKTIVCGIGSTHPSMIELFHQLFSRYGHFKEYPHKTNFGYDLNIKYYLDLSFEFLVDKLGIVVPVQQDLFLSFLAGYADAEGCWKIYGKRKKFIELRFDLETQDIRILRKIKDKLEEFGLTPKLYLVKEKGTKIGQLILKKDMHRLSLCRRNEVVKLAKMLAPFIKHQEKKRKIRLLLSVGNKKRYEEVESDVNKLKSEIENEVSRFVKQNELAYFERRVGIK